MESNKIKDQINKHLRTELKSSQNLIESLKSQLSSAADEHSQIEKELAQKAEGLSVELTEILANIRSKEDIEHIIHHDSRSALASLAIAPNLLLDNANLTSQQIDIIKEMKKSATRLINLFDMNLALQRIEHGKFIIKATTINVLDIILSVVSLHETTIQTKKLSIKTKVLGARGEQDEAFYIYGNQVLTFNILNNLISNAIESSHNFSEICIYLDKNGCSSISITNTGEVPDRIRDVFFNKFVTADKKHGTGIGTYSAMLMAKAQNGNIILDSSEFDATTIIVTFPNPPEK